MRGKRSLGTLQIFNHSLRFNKTKDIFPSVTRVLSIFLTTAATSVNVEKVNSKMRVPKVSRSILAASYAKGELSAVITQLMSKCL